MTLKYCQDTHFVSIEQEIIGLLESKGKMISIECQLHGQIICYHIGGMNIGAPIWKEETGTLFGLNFGPLY